MAEKSFIIMHLALSIYHGSDLLTQELGAYVFHGALEIFVPSLCVALGDDAFVHAWEGGNRDKGGWGGGGG